MPIRCQCKKTQCSSSQCTCKKNNQPCTPACACSSSTCHNEATVATTTTTTTTTNTTPVDDDNEHDFFLPVLKVCTWNLCHCTWIHQHPDKWKRVLSKLMLQEQPTIIVAQEIPLHVDFSLFQCHQFPYYHVSVCGEHVFIWDSRVISLLHRYEYPHLTFSQSASSSSPLLRSPATMRFLLRDSLIIFVTSVHTRASPLDKTLEECNFIFQHYDQEITRRYGSVTNDGKESCHVIAGDFNMEMLDFPGWTRSMSTKKATTGGGKAYDYFFLRSSVPLLDILQYGSILRHPRNSRKAMKGISDHFPQFCRVIINAPLLLPPSPSCLVEENKNTYLHEYPVCYPVTTDSNMIQEKQPEYTIEHGDIISEEYYYSENEEDDEMDTEKPDFHPILQCIQALTTAIKNTLLIFIVIAASIVTWNLRDAFLYIFK